MGRLARWGDAVVVAGSALFVLWQLHPELILSDSTPAGGDMGAHVWAFGYLRDHLLPHGLVSGWSPDWYAGFPVFHFYMVVPFLLMVVLNAGWSGPPAVAAAAGALVLAARAGGASWRNRFVLGVIAALAAVGLVVGAITSYGSGFAAVLQLVGAGAGALALWRGRGSLRRRLGAAAVLVGLGLVSVPYGTAFKMVAVSGVVAMPVCSYAFARLARLPHPTPALISVATLGFLFDKNFTIYGGNIASTMAGEFAFSISLAVSLVLLGFVVRGLSEGRHRTGAAVTLAVVGLCHLIPAIYSLVAIGVFVIVHLLAEPQRAGREGRRVVVGAVGVVGAAVLAAALAAVGGIIETATAIAGGLVLVVIVLVLMASRVGPEPERAEVDAATDVPAVPFVRGRLWWTVSFGAVGALLAAWWMLPFLTGRTYLNDMGWEKIAVHRDGVRLLDWFLEEVWSVLVPADLRLVAALALVGAVLSVVFRNRVGVSLTVCALVAASAFVYAPQGRLWNARLLPFWYLLVYLLAAVAVGEIVRAVAQVSSTDPERPLRAPVALAPIVGFALVAGILGAQLHQLPGGRTNPDGSYRMIASVGVPGLFSIRVPDALALDVEGRNFVTDWSRWNFSGYEGKAKYPEYRAIVDTMADVGSERGCGRALWEYSQDLNEYGTPMALMLLPHWTDGCIGSMEGLYFEASSTTPFHFLVQSELSAQPSRAQRDMPYREFDIDAGVDHLQLLGVRYYLAKSPTAVAAADDHPDLTVVANSGPWVVYEVADAPLVEGLTHEPAVTTGGESQHQWLCSGRDDANRCTGTALDWFQDAGRWDVPLAATGPEEWQRVDPGEGAEPRPLPAVAVDDVIEDRQSISFRVDRVGVPVLVKASYFPNWSARGADGPFRVAPNLMVVIPTDEEVRLTYGRTGVEVGSMVLSLIGVVALVALARRPPLRLRPIPSVDSATSDL